MNDTTNITIPSGTPGLGATILDLTRIYDAERLLPEIAAVTSDKAPLLLAIFNEAFNDLVRTIRIVELESFRAKVVANKIRSRIILDEAKGILKQKGLTKETNPAGSEDLRRAVLEASDEYTTALERENFLEVTSEFLRGKMKAFDMAYNAVKKIMGDQVSTYHRNPSLGTDIPEETPVGGTVERKGHVYTDGPIRQKVEKQRETYDSAGGVESYKGRPGFAKPKGV